LLLEAFYAMPRFVILRHEMPEDSSRAPHWDFMVEQGESLRTWALAEEPALECDIAADPLPDHRLAYLDYEGPVSGNRGHVTQWDNGECKIEESTPERFVIAASGRRLTGRVEIQSGENLQPACFRWLQP
jgi:hypothetical protein